MDATCKKKRIMDAWLLAEHGKGKGKISVHNYLRRLWAKLPLIEHTISVAEVTKHNNEKLLCKFPIVSISTCIEYPSVSLSWNVSV
jgi:hypothetical protein